MDEQPVTPLAYLTEICATSWKHGGELTVAVACVIAVGLTALVGRSLMHLHDLGGAGHVLLVLLPPIGAVLLFEAGVAAWRLHRRQRIALATRQSLLDLNAGDRAVRERHLLMRHRERQGRLEERHAARVQRLTNEIAALQTEVTRHSASWLGSSSPS